MSFHQLLENSDYQKDLLTVLPSSPSQVFLKVWEHKRRTYPFVWFILPVWTLLWDRMISWVLRKQAIILKINNNLQKRLLKWLLQICWKKDTLTYTFQQKYGLAPVFNHCFLTLWGRNLKMLLNCEKNINENKWWFE